VRVLLISKQYPAVGQNTNNVGVRLFKKFARHRGDGINEVSIKPDPMNDRESVRLPEREIIDTISGRDVDNAGPILGAYKVG